MNSENNIVCGFDYDFIGFENGETEFIWEHDFDNSDKYQIKIHVKKDGKKYWINEKCKCIANCN